MFNPIVFQRIMAITNAVNDYECKMRFIPQSGIITVCGEARNVRRVVETALENGCFTNPTFTPGQSTDVYIALTSN